jgi:hypothetical protein
MMAMMTTIAEQATVLAGKADHDAAVTELIVAAGAQRAVLEAVRVELVGRLQARSDDWAATGALRLVVAALAKIGWQGTYAWGDRKKRFSKQRTD